MDEAKRIVLGVSGSIAAYKACDVLRGLIQSNVSVRVVLTPNASRFVAPLTFSVLSKHAALSDPYDPQLWDMAHLSLASWAQLILIAPITADLMARLASGNAGGLLESLVLASKAPVALCPAMDTEMWEHPATQANVVRLKGYGYKFWGPVHGPLASGRVGMGRLMEPSEIVASAVKAIRGKAEPALR